MLVDIVKIKENEHNPRKITEEMFNKLVDSIREDPKILDAKPLVVEALQEKDAGSDVTYYRVLGGNMRLKALKSLGYKEVNVFDASDWSDETKRRFIVKDNLSHGVWDYDLLSAQYDMAELEHWGMDDLDKYYVEEASEKDDKVPEVTDTTLSQVGDLYEFNGHKILCGDSTLVSDMDEILTQKADMIFTDPPYGVNYDGGHADKEKRRDKLENDDTPDIYKEFLPVAVSYMKDGGAFYMWYSDSKSLSVLQAVEAVGLKVRNHIIWNKNMAQFGAIGAQYKSKHEPCLYMFKDGFAPYWAGVNNEVSVWDIDRSARNDLHPTQKPVDLCLRAIQNSSKADDIVFDPFLGSGATVIACEKSNRKCYGIEIEPKYVDVIVQRYVDFTNNPHITKNGQAYEWPIFEAKEEEEEST